MSKVSICIPTYNNGVGVERLLNSIKEQTYSDFEIIITDDSTTSDVQEVVNHFDMNIKYVRNDSHNGSTANWNKAIDLSNGDFIKIMHHDDWFTNSDSLQKFVKLLDDNPSAIMAFSGTRQVNSKESYTRFIAPDDANLIKEDWRNLYLGNTIGAPSAVIHRKTSLRYDNNLRWLVDMDFYMNLLKDKCDFVYSEEPLISIGMSDDQITQDCVDNSELNCFEYKYLFSKYGLGTEDKYREKLQSIFLYFDVSTPELEGTGLDIKQYKKAQRRKLCQKIKDKLHAL